MLCGQGGVEVNNILLVNKISIDSHIVSRGKISHFNQWIFFWFEKCVHLIRLISSQSCLKAKQIKTPRIPSRFLIVFLDGVGVEGIMELLDVVHFP